MQLHGLHQPVAAAMQRLNILMRPVLVIEVPAQLRDAPVNRIIGSGPAVPGIRDQVVTRDALAVSQRQ